MSSEQRQLIQGPPEAPEIPRRFEIRALQAIGVPLIMLLPILALLGVFGHSSATVQAAADPVALSVEYPARTRYETANRLEVRIQNRTAEPLSDSVLRINRSFLDDCSSVVFTPEPSKITPQYVEFEMGNLDETQSVTVEFKPETSGVFRGQAVFSSSSTDDLPVSFEMFVFP